MARGARLAAAPLVAMRRTLSILITGVAVLCAACAGTAADTTPLPSRPVSLIVSVFSCRKPCKPYTVTFDARGAWNFQEDSDPEHFSGHMKGAEQKIDDLVKISKSQPVFQLAGNQTSAGATAAITAYTAQGSYWAPIPSGGQSPIASFVQDLADSIRSQAIRQMTERKAHIARYGHLTEVDFAQAPLGTCTSLHARIRKSGNDVIARVPGPPQPYQLKSSTSLSAFVSILERNNADDLHGVYRTKWHDLTGVALSLKYSDGWQFAISAPDRTQWPSNLKQIVSETDALLLRSPEVYKTCDGRK